MHVATVMSFENELEPSLKNMIEAFKKKEEEFEGIIKIGRTHTQDATPVTLSQEFSGFRVSLEHCLKRLQKSIQDVRYLAQGGTAVGTGLNSFKEFDT
jgi:fumarate hydratase class II